MRCMDKALFLSGIAIQSQPKQDCSHVVSEDYVRNQREMRMKGVWMGECD